MHFEQALAAFIAVALLLWAVIMFLRFFWDMAYHRGFMDGMEAIARTFRGAGK